MSIWIQIYSAAQFMNFFIKMTNKRSNPTSHDIYNWMLNLMFFYVLATSLQCCNIIINCLCCTNLRNINFETMCIMELKLVIINSRHAFNFRFIHATVTISFTCHMIFNIFIILMVFCQLIHECFIAAICS